MDKQITYVQWRARLNEITPSDMRLGEDVLLIEGSSPKELKMHRLSVMPLPV